MEGAIRLLSRSVDETREIGAAVGSCLQGGDVVSLTGELGAGKTAFVQGAAAALGVAGQVSSPTFVLVRDYEGRVPVHHADVYRLGRIQDVIDLGFEEMLDAGGVTFVEWGDAVEALLTDTRLTVELTLDAAPDDDPASIPARRIVLVPSGDGWGPRWAGLVERTKAWVA